MFMAQSLRFTGFQWLCWFSPESLETGLSSNGQPVEGTYITMHYFKKVTTLDLFASRQYAYFGANSNEEEREHNKNSILEYFRKKRAHAVDCVIPEVTVRPPEALPRLRPRS